jgi:hypothetical protein
MTIRTFTLYAGFGSCLLLLLACGSEDIPAAPGLSANGGATTSGGAVGAGGATGNGGAVGTTGGATSNGGAIGSGGAAATGGAVGVGGSADTGGAQATGGASTTGTGGAKATGGATNAGGAPATGGAKATGGASTTGTGGAKATGGASTTGTGGAKATGGASTTGTGGAKATGGASTSTGGATATGGGTGTSTCANFSFFATSLEAIRRESANTDGYGGDLGGLAGADAICTRIATASLACAGQKTWRAFLSTSTVSAISRVGTGPWYDRMGRLVSSTAAGLVNTRPLGADATIINDLPNEFGVPNHSPDGTIVDNHDFLTGSNSQGLLYGATATCSDWTSTTATGAPRVGHSWPRSGAEGWINAMSAPGCARGINTSSQGNGSCANSAGVTVAGVGCAGGYGGFYCLATTP